MIKYIVIHVFEMEEKRSCVTARKEKIEKKEKENEHWYASQYIVICIVKPAGFARHSGREGDGNFLVDAVPG